MMAIKISTKVTFISTLRYAVIRAFFLDTLILVTTCVLVWRRMLSCRWIILLCTISINFRNMCNKLIWLFVIHFFTFDKLNGTFFTRVKSFFGKHLYESIFKHFFWEKVFLGQTFRAPAVCLCALCAICVEWNRPWLLMGCLKCSRHLFI